MTVSSLNAQISYQILNHIKDMIEGLPGCTGILQAAMLTVSPLAHSAGSPWQTAFARNREVWDVISPVISVV